MDNCISLKAMAEELGTTKDIFKAALVEDGYITGHTQTKEARRLKCFEVTTGAGRAKGGLYYTYYTIWVTSVGRNMFHEIYDGRWNKEVGKKTYHYTNDLGHLKKIIIDENLNENGKYNFSLWSNQTGDFCGSGEMTKQEIEDYLNYYNAVEIRRYTYKELQ